MSNWFRSLIACACFFVTASAWAQEIGAPEGHPPDYYPGTVNGVPTYRHAEWQQWMDARKAGLDAQRPAIEAAKQSGRGSGCIGRPPSDCVVTLFMELVIADDFTKPSFIDPPQVDVNGKPIVPKFLEIYAFRAGTLPQNRVSRIPYLQDRHPLFLFLSAADKITEIRMEATPLVRARSEADYDQTFIYELLHPLLSPACPQMPRADLYRFIENKLKAPVRNATTEGQTAKLRVNTWSSPLLPLCGRKLKLEVITERPRYHPDDLKVSNQLIIR